MTYNLLLQIRILKSTIVSAKNGKVISFLYVTLKAICQTRKLRAGFKGQIQSAELKNNWASS